ncbi:uncharacterized protein isoform X2 [Rhodnius prolixus]|uniref:uncharacterized protein isoform X2 n=1 Tax=Rhodnius prolixus TaxID=13249 RepID=UPI003D18789D
MSNRNFITRSKFTLCSVDEDNHFKEKLTDLNNEQKKGSSDKNTEIKNYKFIGCDSEDDIVPVVLPKVDFCDTPEYLFTSKEKCYPPISDLRENDREKIAHLIGEIMRYKDMYNKRNEDYQLILNDNLKKNEKIIQLEQDLSAFKLGCQAKENDITFLTDAHKIQETALKKQILEFQKTIMTLTKEKLNLEINVQKLKKQNEHFMKVNTNIDKEKQKLQKKYILMKDRLKMSLHFISNGENKMKNNHQKNMINGKYVQEKKENTEQWKKLDDGNNKISFKLTGPDQEILTQKREMQFDDDLINELFFLPSQQTFPDFPLFSFKS